jgi:L-lysine 6-transaminase
MKEAIRRAHGIPVDQAIAEIGKHLLVDGFSMVIDVEASKGSRLVDAKGGKTYLDFFMFFASVPIGFNHPRLLDDDFLNTLAAVAVNKPSNSDFYTTHMAEFVATCDRYAIPDFLPHIFFVSGGALGVENALKAAFDYKVRKNFAKGADKEIGTQVIHFRDAFHGRTGYTLSLTNTDPVKTKYFPKFNWPRISNPAIRFPLDEHLDEVVKRENQAKQEIKDAIKKHGDDIAALIIEPIQGEGGDNHYRPEFFKFLREITAENDIIFVCDEVQTGVGLTGKFWAFEHLGVKPDAIAFGKKMQTCGVMASKKFDEVDSVFKVSGRINSTWGGNLVDMVRSTRYLEVIAEENLVENARKMGAHLVGGMQKVADRYPDVVTNVRGRGLMAAFDLPADKRDAFRKKALENGLIMAGCGPHSMRFRPALNVTAAEIDEGLDIIDRTIKQVVIP